MTTSIALWYKMRRFKTAIRTCVFSANRSSSDARRLEDAPKPESQTLKSARRFSAHLSLFRLLIEVHRSRLWRHVIVVLAMSMEVEEWPRLTSAISSARYKRLCRNLYDSKRQWGAVEGEVRCRCRDRHPKAERGTSRGVGCCHQADAPTPNRHSSHHNSCDRQNSRRSHYRMEGFLEIEPQ
jgi:hypothetical protein